MEKTFPLGLASATEKIYVSAAQRAASAGADLLYIHIYIIQNALCGTKEPRALFIVTLM